MCFLLAGKHLVLAASFSWDMKGGMKGAYKALYFLFV